MSTLKSLKTATPSCRPPYPCPSCVATLIWNYRVLKFNSPNKACSLLAQHDIVYSVWIEVPPKLQLPAAWGRFARESAKGTCLLHNLWSSPSCEQPRLQVYVYLWHGSARSTGRQGVHVHKLASTLTDWRGGMMGEQWRRRKNTLIPANELINTVRVDLLNCWV